MSSQLQMPQSVYPNSECLFQYRSGIKITDPVDPEEGWRTDKSINTYDRTSVQIVLYAFS